MHVEHNSSQSPVPFIISFETKELPVRLLTRAASKVTKFQFQDSQQSFTVFLSDELFESVNELDLSAFSVFLFQIVCYKQFFNISISGGVSVDFAKRMDQLPKYYSALWAECYKSVGSQLKRT